MGTITSRGIMRMSTLNSFLADMLRALHTKTQMYFSSHAKTNAQLVKVLSMPVPLSTYSKLVARGLHCRHGLLSGSSLGNE